MAYYINMFLHIGAVTIVNNRDHTLHYVIEEEIKSHTCLTQQSVVEECGHYFKGLILIQKTQKCFKLHDVNILFIADLERTKNIYAIVKTKLTASECNRP